MFSVIRCNAKILRMVVVPTRIQACLKINRFKSNLAADAKQSTCAVSVSVSLNSGGIKEWAAEATNADWEKVLTPEQYCICREGSTEVPFTGMNFSNFEEGIYKCVCCSSDLFCSEAKYDSGYGWPSFQWAEQEGSSCKVMKRQEKVSALAVTQVVCTHCESQLGHVLQDHNNPSKDCYCINSEALQFEPK